MKTLILSKMPEYASKAVDEAIPLAYGFLCAKYGWLFDDVIMIMQPHAKSSGYFHNENKPHAKYGHTPVVTIAVKSELLLYVKNSIGKYKDRMNVGYVPQIACAIVHELTHHIQFKRGKKEGNKCYSFSELETTANELEFLKVTYPEWYKLIMIEEK